jgi:hypothetical protein
MRTIQTFVLRLFVDTEEPNTLRGSLRPISNEAEYPFADARELLDLLQQLAALPGETRCTRNDAALDQSPATQLSNPQNQ